MNRLRKKKLLSIGFIVLGVSLAISIALYALKQNINLFYTPTQVIKGEVSPGTHFRIGGLVKKNSVKKSPQGLEVQFTLTDMQSNVTVDYKGILPDLFREGQGIVALGQINSKGVFIAEQVLAKHDANYMPPEVNHALNASKGKQ